jgi:hypothetical protein
MPAQQIEQRRAGIEREDMTGPVDGLNHPNRSGIFAASHFCNRGTA